MATTRGGNLVKRLHGLLLLSLALLLSHHQICAQEKEELFEVPLKYVSFFLLNDAKCPLQLTYPRVFATDTGHIEYYYSISNSRDVSVKSFKVEGFDVFENPSYTASPFGTAQDELAFVPYEILSILDESRVTISPLSKDRVTSFKLSEDRKKIWIALVTKVTMYDGSVYDATSKFSAIKKFIDGIEYEDDLAAEDDAPKLPFAEKEKRLRDFLSEVMQDKR